MGEAFLFVDLSGSLTLESDSHGQVPDSVSTSIVNRFLASSNENQNLPDRPPPFVDPLFPAVTFEAPHAASQFRSQNQARPYTQFTVTGPDAVPYFVGLAIVPIVLAVFLLLWLLTIMCLGCCQDRLAGKERNPSIKRWYVWAVISGLLFASMVSWACALGFSISTLDDANLSESARQIGKVALSVNGYLANASEHITSAQTAMLGVSASCNPFNDTVQIPVKKLGTLVNITEKAVSDAQATVVSFMGNVARQLFKVSDDFSYFFYVRTVVLSCVSAFQVLITLVCLIVAIMGTMGQVRNIQWFNVGCCCKGCCTPVLSIAIISTILMVIFAAVMHAMALVLSDICAPNVNIAINRVAGEFFDYPGFAQFSGDNLTSMCSASSTIQAERPLELSLLCFYQTCNVETDYVDRILGSVDSIFHSAQLALNDSTPLIQAIDSMVSNSTCTTFLDNVLPSFGRVVLDAWWALSSLSCHTINKIYANAVYELGCNDGAPRLVATFQSWLSGCVFLMIALAVWLVFRDFLHDPNNQELATVLGKPQSTLMFEKPNVEAEDLKFEPVPQAVRPKDDESQTASIILV